MPMTTCDDRETTMGQASERRPRRVGAARARTVARSPMSSRRLLHRPCGEEAGEELLDRPAVGTAVLVEPGEDEPGVELAPEEIAERVAELERRTRRHEACPFLGTDGGEIRVGNAVPEA